MSRESGDLVSETLGLDHGDVVNDALIYMEVVGQPTQTRPFVSTFSTASGSPSPPALALITYFP